VVDHNLERGLDCHSPEHDTEERRLVVKIGIVRPLVLIAVDVQDREFVTELISDKIAERVEECIVLVVRVGVAENHHAANPFG